MSSTQFQFDTGHDAGAPDFLGGIRKAMDAGKGIPGMLMEMAKLRMGAGKLRPDEYLMYELYDDERFDAESRKTYLSDCLLYTSPSPRDATLSRMPSSA